MNTEEQLAYVIQAHEDWTKIALNSTDRLAVVENENAVLRQLVKDLLAWTSEGFLLIGNAKKAEWEQRYKELQQQVKDLLGERAL